MRVGLVRHASVFLLLLGVSAPAVSQARRVVLLYDERTEFPGLAALDARLGQALTAGLPDVEVYREAMDLSRFQSSTYPTLLKDYLRAKYADKRIDVVIAAMGPALTSCSPMDAKCSPGHRLCSVASIDGSWAIGSCRPT